MTPHTRETLCQLLLRGALDDDVDLGSDLSVQAYLTRKGVHGEAIRTLTDADLDEVRRRLQRRTSLLDRFEAGLERVADSGALPFLLLVAMGLVALYLWQALKGQAHAATIVRAEPTPSTVAGILVALVPIVLACLFAGIALHGPAPAEDEEAFGDATQFGDEGR